MRACRYGESGGVEQVRVPYLALAADHEALHGQGLEPHRPVRMQARGRYPISAPRPSSPPSEKREDALTMTTAERSDSTNVLAAASSGMITLRPIASTVARR